ncbi:hypothetical protein [Thermogutta sp.]|jgi:hypothetical protein|uniref:hypothetical protein n=1 Tax=Thermogutta sp. TaxID=1962930 RepID=UPI00321FE97C
MLRVFALVLMAGLALTTLGGCGGKKPEANPQFNPETAKHPEKIANPMEGIQPGQPPGPPGPVRTGP